MSHLRDYISKVIDRNLQRKRESGITVYALYSVLAIVLWQLVERYPSIPFRERPLEVLLVSTCALNIMICLALLHAAYTRQAGLSGPIRLLLFDQMVNSLLDDIVTCGTVVVPSLANIASFILKLHHGSSFDWYYFLFGLFLTAGLAGFVSAAIKGKKNRRFYQVIAGSGKSTDRDIPTAIVYFLFMFVMAYSGYRLYISSPAVSTLSVAVFAALAYSLILILERTTQVRREDYFLSSLKNLEYETNVRDLSDEDIRLRLQKNYLGFMLPEWISFHRKEFDDFETEIASARADLARRRSELPDGNSPEHKERANSIDTDQDQLRDKVVNYFTGVARQVRMIRKSGRLLSEESRELSEFLRSVLDKVDTIYPRSR